MARPIRNGICTCTSIRRCCARRRFANLWSATNCSPRPSATSRLSQRQKDLEKSRVIQADEKQTPSTKPYYLRTSRAVAETFHLLNLNTVLEGLWIPYHVALCIPLESCSSRQ